jgi:hypothetical protein
MWRFLMARIEEFKIAAALEDDCWMKVRAKAAVLQGAAAREYVQGHCAGAVHREVDALVRNHPELGGGEASQLIVRTTERLTNRLLRRLAKEKRRYARAA